MHLRLAIVGVLATAGVGLLFFGLIASMPGVCYSSRPAWTMVASGLACLSAAVGVGCSA